MAKLEIDFQTADVRRILRNFQELVGREEILKYTKRVADEIARRNIVSQSLLDRYAIPLGLQKACTYERKTGRQPDPLSSSDLYDACTFAAAAVSLSRTLNLEARTRLASMIRGVINWGEDARRLQHELTVAAHFSQRGWEVQCMDLEEGGGFDYLVSKGGTEMEVECKTISGDKGNAIHQIDALNFMEHIHEPLLKAASTGIWTIDVTFAVGLPKDRQTQLNIAKRIVQFIKDGGQTEQGDDLVIDVRHAKMPSGCSTQQAHSLAGRLIRPLQERLNGHVGAIYSTSHVLALCVSSERPSRVVDYAYDEIKKACSQLSGTRPGYVWTHFTDLADQEMRTLLKDDGRTPFDAISLRIFDNEARRHVTALSYTAEGVLQKRTVHAPNSIRHEYSRQGAMPTHFNNLAAFPISHALY